MSRSINGHARMAFHCALIMTLALAVTGCGGGDGLERIEVHGAVTLNGEPVTAGRVNFVPEGETRGPASGTDITDGTYRIAENRGPVPGTYLVRVQITGQRPDAANDASALPTKQEVMSGEKEVNFNDRQTDRDASGSNSEDASPLQFLVTVTADSPNEIDLPVVTDDN